MLGWRGEELLLSLSPEGVRFLREQWSGLRELVRWQLSCCSTDPLAELTGLPVPTGPIDWRLAYLVDYWCGIEECGPVRQVREGRLLHGLEPALGRALAMLPRCGGVVTLPGWGHPATIEWSLMVETLHVVLDICGRVRKPGRTERVLTPSRSAANVESYRRSLRWLELVLDTLADAEHTSWARAAR